MYKYVYKQKAKKSKNRFANFLRYKACRPSRCTFNKMVINDRLLFFNNRDLNEDEINEFLLRIDTMQQAKFTGETDLGNKYGINPETNEIQTYDEIFVEKREWHCAICKNPISIKLRETSLRSLNNYLCDNCNEKYKSTKKNIKPLLVNSSINFSKKVQIEYTDKILNKTLKRKIKKAIFGNSKMSL